MMRFPVLVHVHVGYENGGNDTSRTCTRAKVEADLVGVRER